MDASGVYNSGNSEFKLFQNYSVFRKKLMGNNFSQ